MSFFKGTVNDKRIIGAISLENTHTWIYAVYDVDNDMRSQTSGSISLGWGIIHETSIIKKLNIKVLPSLKKLVSAITYLKIFKNNVLYQDNQSAIRIEENGRNSCTGNSRYIDIRYFFSKDRVYKKEISIKYCPTTKILVNFFTKPLQGDLFWFFRNILIGYVSIEEIINDDI